MFAIPLPVRQALARLRNHGYEAYLVGGCLRDLLLGNAPQDWDIATDAVPIQTEAVFADCRLLETGLKHGTVTVLWKGQPLEITTYRTESAYTDHRHPDQVAFSKSLTADLSRRDFTMNALAYQPQTGLVDPFGGAADISAAVIRCVGDPEQRFQEDGLRLLRALRFAAQLGFRIEEHTAAALRANGGLLTEISAERIREELTKLLCSQDVGQVLRDYADVLGVPIAEIRPMIGFDQHNVHHCYDVWQHTVAVVENCPPTPQLRWAALLHDIGKPGCFSRGQDGVGHFYGHAAAGKELATAILRRLKFSTADRCRIVLLIAYHDVTLPVAPKTVIRWLNRFGSQFFAQLLSLRRADNLGQAPQFRNRQKECDRLEALLQQVLAEQALLLPEGSGH